MSDGAPVRLVLDESAVQAYLSGEGVAVGEALALTLDDGAAFGVHITTLVSAECSRPVGAMTTKLLVNHAAFRALTATVVDYMQLVGLTHQLGALEPALAIASAANHDALLLTADINLYAELKETSLIERIITIED